MLERHVMTTDFDTRMETMDLVEQRQDSGLLDADDTMGTWAFTQYLDKYAWKDEAGDPIEVWPDTAYRVVRHVLGALGYTDRDPEFQDLVRLIAARKFIPGGRYLASAGKRKHQVNNCFLYRCPDSLEGWADTVWKGIMGLGSGGGIGVVYSDVRAYGSTIKTTGGIGTGPLSPARMVNEIAREVISGGNRRSAIWGGLHWNHGDIFNWIHAKDWSDEVCKAKAEDYNFAAPLDMTNISVILDDAFFEAFEDENHPDHELAYRVYYEATANMVKNGEPGFSIDVGENSDENLRNAPVAGDTHVLVKEDITPVYRPAEELVGKRSTVWTGKQWAREVEFTKTKTNAKILAVEMTGGRIIRCDPSHEFLVERYIGAGKRRKLNKIHRIAAQDLEVGDQIHVAYSGAPARRRAMTHALNTDAYTLGWIYGDGSFTQSGGAELTLCSDESKACLRKIGGYSSITESDGRGYIRMYFGVDPRWANRSKDIFPVEVLEDTRKLISFIAGLFDADGNWEPTQKRIRLASKHEGFLRQVARGLEQLGVMAHVTKAGHSTYGKAQGYQLVVASSYTGSFAAMIPTVRLQPDLENYESYRQSAIKVVSVTEDGFEDVYCADVGVGEHSFMAEGVIVSNCTEITSGDDSDVCNLGSINMARIESPEEFEETVRLATLFLIAGTVYSDIPHHHVKGIREKNRRLGLGLMGIHEWLLVRGYKYEMVPELERWLDRYTKSTEYANVWADQHSLSRPVKTRAIAPNGTIGILAETTTSAEPIFCLAYKRRFLGKDNVWYHQYVIDATARHLIEEMGVPIDAIEDAYTLSYDVEKRIKFQSELQRFVDHGISSTINLPYQIVDPEEVVGFANTLFPYLRNLRGITCYPDGARAGQPFEAVPYEYAVTRTGVTFEDNRDNACKGGACGV